MTVKNFFVAPPLCDPETNANSKTTRELTDDQKAAFDELKSHIHNDTSLTDRHKAFCTDACLHRYLRARDYHVKHAEALLRSTLKWRDEYKPDEISPYGCMDEEACTGKILVAGQDRLGRPVLYMRPAYQNTKNYEEQNRLTVYMLERCVQAMDVTKGVETLALIIDYSGYSLRTAPPLAQSKEIVQILSDHYPERLGLALMVDAPYLFHATYKVMQPFIPAETKKKVHFIHGHKDKHMAKHFDLDTLPVEYGGRWKVEYNHDHYWRNEKAVWDRLHPKP